jgi:hypothetical protein
MVTFLQKYIQNLNEMKKLKTKGTNLTTPVPGVVGVGEEQGLLPEPLAFGGRLPAAAPQPQVVFGACGGWGGEHLDQQAVVGVWRGAPPHHRRQHVQRDAVVRVSGGVHLLRVEQPQDGLARAAHPRTYHVVHQHAHSPPLRRRVAARRQRHPPTQQKFGGLQLLHLGDVVHLKVQPESVLPLGKQRVHVAL